MFNPTTETEFQEWRDKPIQELTARELMLLDFIGEYEND